MNEDGFVCCVCGSEEGLRHCEQRKVVESDDGRPQSGEVSGIFGKEFP